VRACGAPAKPSVEEHVSTTNRHPADEATSHKVEPRSDFVAGIYLHVPFCARQCPYCDFAVDVRRDIPHRAYADALLAEFESRKHCLEGRSVRTIYIGGGTPSLWSPAELTRVLETLRQNVGSESLLEICMEANPVDITPEKLEAWADAGVNRLSIGCQSFEPRILKVLNRVHTSEQALGAVELALEKSADGSGPGIVSLDLIFGNPEQTMQEWERDLDVVERLEGLKHLSAYNLTIEPGTAFARRKARGRLSVPDDDHAFSMLERLIERCEAIGLERYEVSNFARTGFRSRHNTLYWTGAEYLGLGVGAHSLHIDPTDGVLRRANPRQTADYLEAPGQPESVEHLSAGEHFVERLFLGVRTREGLDFAQVRHQFRHAVPAEAITRAEALLEAFCRQNFLARDGDTFTPTHRGLNLADSLAESLAVEFDAL
jgi:oxygen-independent coproporphyrinogen-3 oxidase